MNRRIFLGRLGWVFGGLIAFRKASAFTGFANKCKGAVLSGGKGLAGVVVSDGYSVVATDKAGKFEFDWHPDATTVAVSTPAGYAFRHEKNISRHYYLAQDATNKEISFELSPLGVDDNEHEFIIWADPQVKNMKDVEKMMNESVPDVQQWVASKQRKELLHGICVGDMTWDNHDMFAEYDRAVAHMNIPFFQCLGNHDMDYTNGSDESSDDTFQRLYGPCDYSFNRGKVHYVVMDNVRYLGHDRDYDGFFAERQLNWLRKDLSFVPQDHLIVLCAHIPIHSGVKNNQDLYAVLGDRKVHIMTGHTHYHVNAVHSERIFEHNHGTVCGAWWTGPICEDGTPNGYGIYKVKGTELDWFYKSTGQQTDHQMSLHVTTGLDGDKQFVANIWNHDPEWKVEHLINGEHKGALEQFTGFDPLAFKNMLGPDLPKPRGFAEPKQTSHLFKTALSADAREVTVVATDRFGKKFTATHKVA